LPDIFRRHCGTSFDLVAGFNEMTASFSLSCANLTGSTACEKNADFIWPTVS
jgi:hypothetical protein